MRKRASGKRPNAVQALRVRLHEAEATLEAIRRGEVDAVVVSSPGGDRTLTLEGATHPYHVLLNAMNEGAALLDHDGTILFGNHRLGEIAGAPVEELRGLRLRELVARTGVDEFLREGAGRGVAGEFAVSVGVASATPVWIALSPLPLGSSGGMTGPKAEDGSTVLMAIITDLTERKAAEDMRLRLLKSLISAEDEERRRIARELHDESGQSLAGLLLGLRTIQDVPIGDARSIAERLRAVVANTFGNLQRMARGLHPRELDEWGLAAAAKRYVDHFGRSLELDASILVEGLDERCLASMVETTMYRILQEALTNVARHARSREVDVRLKVQGPTLELVVRDDGVGFDASGGHRTPGLGLHGMHERVALLGGSVEIESSPGRGTSVRARIPHGMPAPR